MRPQDRFLRKLFEQTDGRTDRTVHAFLHVARPLALSPEEARTTVSALVREGLIGMDPMFDRLIWLTPAGAAADRRLHTVDVVGDIARDASILPTSRATAYDGPLYHDTNAAADQ